MAPLPTRPQSPPPEARSNFSVGSNGFRVFGNVQLLFPENLEPRVSEPGGLRASNVTAQWIRGQLEFYNVFYENSWSRDELADALEAAVRNKECTEIPADISEIQRELGRTFNEKAGAAYRDLRAWCTNNPNDADIVFEHLMSPTAEANFDFERFLDRHFPEMDDRRPRDRKTHWPIALPSFWGTESVFRRFVEGRGLKHDVSGKGYEATFILGSVYPPLYKLRQDYNDFGYKRKYRDREMEVKRFYNQHVDYCNTQPPKTGGGPACDLLRPVGHWVLRCDTIVPMFDIPKPMTLDVHNIPHNPPVLKDSKHAQVPMAQRSIEEKGIIAHFDFGGRMSGTMAISADPYILPPFQKVQECFDEQPCFHKRLYFEWTGYSEFGNFQRPEKLANTGFLDFDEDYTVFKGVFQTDSLGGELVIRGFKISDVPQTVPRSFYNYDQKPDEGSLGSGSMEESEDDDEAEAMEVDGDEEAGNEEAARQKIVDDDQIDWVVDSEL